MINWNPFKKAKEEKERAAKLEEKLALIIEKQEEERAERLRVEAQLKEIQEAERAEREKEQRLEQLANEEKERQEAAKKLATERGEPFFIIKDFQFDEGLSGGAIELDWNDIFVNELKKNGFVGETDEDVVDLWFQHFCKHVAMETYEQEEANIGQNIQKRDLGDGKSEYL